MKARQCAASMVAAAAMALALAACGRSTQSSPSGGPGATQPGAIGTMAVSSPAFGQGQPIPAKYTEDGQDVSPELRWSGAPPQTHQLALVVDDPDAPSAQPWVHWVIYAIAPSTSVLPEGVPNEEAPAAPAGAKQGKNSWGTVGYRGPAPPAGKVHHYHFKLYALDTQTSAGPGLDKAALLQQIEGHIIAQGELVGTYQR